MWTRRLSTKVSHHTYKQLGLDHVKDLPRHDVVPLSWQQFKPRKLLMPLLLLLLTLKLPVIMLHGFLGLKQNYLLVGRKISELTGHPVFGVDLRNHGQSPHASPHTYPVLAHDVSQLVEDQQWHDAIIVGHLMGAKVAMICALQHPKLYSKLVIIDNSPVQAALVALTRDLEAMGHVEAQYRQFSDKPTAKQLDKIEAILKEYEPDAGVRLFLKSNFDKHDPLRAFRVPVLNFLKDDVLNDMGGWPDNIPKHCRFPKPTLVMKGAHLDFIKTEYKPAFDHYFPNNQLKVYDSGHWVVQQRPEEVVRDIVDFINH